MYALQIIEAIESASQGKLRIGFGSLYPTLHKLEKKGFVNSCWGEETPEERGHARRRYYQITGLGEQALLEKERFRQNLTRWQPEGGV